MNTHIDVEVKSFPLPEGANIVTDTIFKKTQNVPLSLLDAATLEALCSEFRVNVFRKAGKKLPDEAAPT